MRISIGQRLDDLKGIGPGFDHLRIGLALSILLWHAFSISYGQDYAHTLARFPVPPLLAALLPMFFALSGFLVMGSALRTANLKTFITFRVLRILPALFTEIMISALVLGPLLTTLPLREYFTDPMFFEYLGSLIGRVRFSLPGLFLDNPAPELVNFALWTVGPEILCYVIMSALMLVGAYRRRKTMTGFTLFYVAICAVTGWFYPSSGFGEVMPTKFLIFGFLAGNLIFLYRDQLPFNRTFAVCGFLLGLGLIFFMQETGLEIFGYAAIPIFAYVISVVGLSNLPPMPFFHRGDYSYGVYIYGFPIQQAVAHFLPGYREWWVNLAISLPIVLVFAVTSWHLIEKPFLGLRKYVLSKNAPDAPERGRSTTRFATTLAALILYGIFVTDASGVLPVRPITKTALHAIGLYQFPQTIGERPASNLPQ